MEVLQRKAGGSCVITGRHSSMYKYSHGSQTSKEKAYTAKIMGMGRPGKRATASRNKET